MKTIHVATAFTLLTPKGQFNIPAGIQTVDDGIADHWYTKAHLVAGGIGNRAYADQARASAVAARTKAAEADAYATSLETAADDAEAQADAQEADAKAASIEATKPVETETPDVDAMTDDELREFIKARDGKYPHPATGHDKLLAAAKGDSATATEIEAEPPAPPAPPAPPTPPATPPIV